MFLPHLHFFSRNAPDGFVEISLPPFHVTQLSRPYEHKRGKLKSASGYDIAVIALDCPQETSQFPGIRDRGHVSGFYRRQGSFEIG